MIYKLRGDGTVVARDDANGGILAVYRLKPGTSNVTQAVNVPRETAPAVWTGPMSEASGTRVNKTVLDMLNGVQPKTTHGATGAKIGAVLGVTSAFVGGPVGPILGAIFGLIGGAWLGGAIKTNASDVTMRPALEIDHG